MDFTTNSIIDTSGIYYDWEEKMVRKIRFYKKLVIEIVETLITICMVLSRDSMGRGMYRNILEGHINELGKFSQKLRSGKEDTV